MDSKTISILTGDIVNSRKENPLSWQIGLKKELNLQGNSPQEWEIFRGDMFQLETSPHQSLKSAIKIKSQIKQIKNVDVRIAIGLGKQQYQTNKITESNGEAYTNSGLCFENLKKKRLAIITPWNDFNEEWNLHLKLASLIMDNWTPTTSLIIRVSLENPEKNQEEIALQLNRSQSTVSASLNRGGFDELQSMITQFEKQINPRIL